MTNDTQDILSVDQQRMIVPANARSNLSKCCRKRETTLLSSRHSAFARAPMDAIFSRIPASLLPPLKVRRTPSAVIFGIAASG
jgi:hypothetical protein